jgi:putative flippase GtrA
MWWLIFVSQTKKNNIFCTLSFGAGIFVAVCNYCSTSFFIMSSFFTKFNTYGKRFAPRLTACCSYSCTHVCCYIWLILQPIYINLWPVLESVPPYFLTMLLGIFFTFMWPYIVTNFLIIKPTRCTNFLNLFWKWNSTYFGQFFCPLSAVIDCPHSNGLCHTALEKQDQGVPSWSCYSKAVYKPERHIPLLSVQWITPDDGQRNCPKHVDFHFQNQFEKLVQLVGFIIRKKVIGDLKLHIISLHAIRKTGNYMQQPHDIKVFIFYPRRELIFLNN